MVFAQFTQTIRKKEPFPWIFRRNSFVQLRSSDFFPSFFPSLSLSLALLEPLNFHGFGEIGDG